MNDDQPPVPRTDMQALAGHAQQLFGAVAEVILGTVAEGVRQMRDATEIAAERAQLQAAVQKIELRMAAYSALLEAVAAQIEALEALQQNARGALRASYGRQIEMLQAQEQAILERSGVPGEAARQAVLALHAEPAAARDGGTHVRQGRRFVAVDRAEEAS